MTNGDGRERDERRRNDANPLISAQRFHRLTQFYPRSSGVLLVSLHQYACHRWIKNFIFQCRRRRRHQHHRHHHRQ